MKNYMIIYSGRLFAVALMAFAITATASAQQAEVSRIRTVYHPGETLTLSLAFDGPGAVQLHELRMTLTAPENKDQPGLAASIMTITSKKSGPEEFEVRYVIPESQATGDYNLVQVIARTEGPNPLTFSYNRTNNLPPLAVRIENDRRGVKPKLKAVTALP